MKTYHERSADVAAKISKLKRERKKRKIVVSTVCFGLAAVLALVLFLPFSTNAPNISRYSGSPYYSLMQRINEATYERPQYVNNFEKLTSQLTRSLGFVVKGDVMEAPEAAVPVPDEGRGPQTGASAEDVANGQYVEVTDNQVEGVVEGDIIKRSDKYIFYLHDGKQLGVYSIEGENSREIAVFNLEDGEENTRYEGMDMYLSQDCNTVYVIRSCYWKAEGKDGTYAVVTALDVSDVTAIKLKEQIYMSGNYLSSRMIGNDLLLMGQYYIRADKDFSQESTFLPMVGTKENMLPVAADDIFAPEELTTTRYTVICKVDGKSMEVKDSAAFLSYSQELYVSVDTIYATRTYTDQTETGSRTMTQITALGYSGEKLEHKGSVSIAGAVKNQYSMDEYNGVLRVVTSTTERISGSVGDNVLVTSKRNVNLTCIDLQTMGILAQVEAFAPEGETAESVRFDGNMAYVCTAEVITLTDPVYFFDLSDLENITWKDTGTIDGYSSSLVNFRDGFLLGIGYGAERELKIEVYDRIGDTVEGICSYKRYASFSEEYKSYLIDRDSGLIGLSLRDWNGKTMKFVLLMFDGYALREVAEIPVYSNRLDNVRAVLIDGWLYVLAADFQTYQIW